MGPQLLAKPRENARIGVRLGASARTFASTSRRTGCPSTPARSAAFRSNQLAGKMTMSGVIAYRCTSWSRGHLARSQSRDDRHVHDQRHLRGWLWFGLGQAQEHVFHRPHHTPIVTAYEAPDKVVVLEQNVKLLGKRVQRHTIATADAGTTGETSYRRRLIHRVGCSQPGPSIRTTYCYMNAECIAQHGVETLGDGFAEIRCTGRSCKCRIEYLGHAPVTRELAFEADCEPSEQVDELLRKRCINAVVRSAGPRGSSQPDAGAQ